MNIEAIYDADEQALANVFEAAFDRLGQLGREGGNAVRAKLLASDSIDVEEGIAQLDELYEQAA
jgi:hypothetical protein